MADEAGTVVRAGTPCASGLPVCPPRHANLGRHLVGGELSLPVGPRLSPPSSAPRAFHNASSAARAALPEFSGIEQKSARLAHNQEVAGANPAPATSSRAVPRGLTAPSALPGVEVAASPSHAGGASLARTAFERKRLGRRFFSQIHTQRGAPPPAPRIPRQPYNELEVEALAGLLIVLALSLAVIAWRWMV